MLSAEYVLADKRYTMREIRSEFEALGFSVLDARYVQAGHWHAPLPPTDPRAKEILLALTL